MLGGIALKQLFSLAPVFSDYMVFQANKPIKIFGSCKKGIELVFTFPHQEVKIKTKEEHFSCEIAQMKTTKQGFSFSVSTKKKSVTIYNCLVGEVFLIAGEANVRFSLKESYIPYVREVPPIRYYQIPRIPYSNAQIEYPNHFHEEASWKISNQENANTFSAIGYYLSIGLFENLNTPIGIISISENDTSIFSFLDEKTILSHTALRRIIVAYQKELDKYTSEHEYKSIFEQELSYLRENQSYRSLPMGPKHFNRPSGMHDLLLNYVMPYPYRAFIYYQGESDWQHSDIYADALMKLISSVRSISKEPKLPFFYVQLAGYTYPGLDKKDIAKLREAQAFCMNTSDYVYMTSSIDYGDPSSITPKDKFPISERLTNLILEKLYKIGKNTLSPSYFSYQINKDKLVIYTEHNSLNLVSKSMQNLGFYFSYDRIHFEECKNVKIENNQIIISNIKNVKMIEYGYENYPLIDIYSSNGLPLLPFRIPIDI